MIAAEGLAAAILCYRIAYFALPALIAAGLVAAGCLAPAATDIRPAPSPLPAPPQAEAGLLRQGFLETLTGPEGGGWIAGRSGQSLVALLDPFGDAPLATLREAARQRGLMPALYKCGPRTALMARAQGWKVQPIAEECWLDPSRFTLDTPLRATLRRKLRHAQRAGIVVTSTPVGGDLPLDQMARLNEDWAQDHGAERGFSMGRFTPDYVAGQKIYLAWLNGNLAAFVTFHQATDEWTLDLVRQGAEAPDGTIPALVHAAISEAARANLPRLSLAARPLTGYGLTGRAGRWAEWCALRSGAEGLRRFKAMFAPNCTRLYLAAPSRLSLVLSAIEIARAICRPPPLPSSAAIARAIAVGRWQYERNSTRS